MAPTVALAHERALYLRSAGYSLEEIAGELHIARSTACRWVRGTPVERHIVTTCQRCGEDFIAARKHARFCPDCRRPMRPAPEPSDPLLMSEAGFADWLAQFGPYR